MNKLPLFQKGSHGSIRFQSGPGRAAIHRVSLFIFIFFVLIVFVVLGVRLFQLTVVRGEYFRQLSEENRIRELLIEAKRGQIIDRKGFVVAKNSEANITKISDRLTSDRMYQEPEATSAIIGYRQIADKEDTAHWPCLSGLKLGDKVGKKAAENVFECTLRGVPGKKLIELDAHGQYVRTLSVQPPQEGKTIQLAMDLELQKKAYELMKGKKGAVIAMNPTTGEVLALVSSPSYNPQNFENNKGSAISGYFTDPSKPLFNRATEGTYPPGSIFKIVIAAAALEDKKIDEKTIFVDNGEIQAGPLKFGNWYFLQYGKTDGPVNIIKGIKRSNDIFFYQVGDLVGPQRIKYWADKFGFGKKTALPFDQAEGLIPSPFWKEDVIKDRWYQGDNYNIAIGQGYLLVTPLQVAQATSVFAGDGKLCEPKLLKDEAPHCKSLGLSEKTLSLIREGMRQACATGGTGWPLFDFSVRDESQLLTPTPTPRPTTDPESTRAAQLVGKRKIAVGCKTGTAENPGKSGVPHAWLTGFAPYENPEIAVTVLVEEGGQGSDVAGPIMRDLLKSYFERKE